MIQLHADYKRHMLIQRYNRCKVKEWKKIQDANSNQNRAGRGTLVTEKTDFETNITRGGPFAERVTPVKKIHSIKYINILC